MFNIIKSSVAKVKVKVLCCRLSTVQKPDRANKNQIGPKPDLVQKTGTTCVLFSSIGLI